MQTDSNKATPIGIEIDKNQYGDIDLEGVLFELIKSCVLEGIAFAKIELNGQGNVVISPMQKEERRTKLLEFAHKLDGSLKDPEKVEKK